MNVSLPLLHALCLSCACSAVFGGDAPKPQYRHADIEIPAFQADEPRRSELSVQLAEDYLRKGALAWKGSTDCISCHTTGLYLTARPQLTPFLGRPLDEMRDFFVGQLREFQTMPAAELKKSTRPAQVIYLAAGLAEWDAHVAKQLSKETSEALAFMFSLQETNGA